MFLLIELAAGILTFFVITQLAQMSVYGWFISDAELDAYFGKYLENAKLNPYSESRSLFCDMPKYVSISRSVLGKWVIEDYGVIPRWSKWTAKLDAKRAELLAKEPIIKRKKLSEI